MKIRNNGHNAHACTYSNGLYRYTHHQKIMPPRAARTGAAVPVGGRENPTTETKPPPESKSCLILIHPLILKSSFMPMP